MSFGQAIKSVFSQYATFSGRARRSEYWWFYLFSALVSIPVQIFFFVMYAVAFASVFEQENSFGSESDIAFDDVDWGLFMVGFIPVVVVGLAFFLPSLAVLVRRLHDTGRSGWWYFISLVPGGSIVLFVFAVMDGQPYDNAYGPGPKVGERHWSPGYGQPQQYAQPGQPPQYGQLPSPDFPPPPAGPMAAPPGQPPTQAPANPDDPFAAPGR
jgi:uncharacterized membrane protein YhaH (DUF805 family)